MARTAHQEPALQMLDLSTASWADGEPENQNRGAPGGLGAGGLGLIKGYYAYCQLRGVSGKDLKPDLPLAQQLFMPDNAGLGRTTTVACVVAQGIYHPLLCTFTICKIPPAFISSFILLLFVFCRVKYSFD